MSRENVELVRRFEAALNARAVPDPLLAPGFVMVNAKYAVTDKTYEGAPGMAEWITDMFEAYDSAARFEIEEIVAEGANCIVTMNRLAGTGARSGLPLVLRWPAVFWLRDGKIVRLIGYARRHEALEAAGLEE